MKRAHASGCLRRAGIAVAGLMLVYLGLRLSAPWLMPASIKASVQSAEGYVAAHPGHLRTRAGIRFVDTGQAGRPTLVLVHGSPGDWTNWSWFLGDPELSTAFRIVAFDRPGYGGSRPGRSLTDLGRHTDELVARVRRHPGPHIWVGHSFGSAIVAQAAMDHPQLVDAAVLVSSGVDPDHEQLKWYHHLGHTWLGRLAMPRDLRVANDECVLFADALKEQATRWDMIRCPTWVVHGRQDGLADFAEAEFAMKRLVNAPATLVELPAAGHLVIWEQPEPVKEAIMQALAAAKPPAGT